MRHCPSQHHRHRLSLLPLTLASALATAQTADSSAPEMPLEAMNSCLQASVTSAASAMTVAELRQACQLLYEQQLQSAGVSEQNQAQLTEQTIAGSDATTNATSNSTSNEDDRLLKRRMTLEALNRSNRFMLTPHKINYFYPASYTRTPNESPYRDNANESLSDLRNVEADFQLSVKILLREDIFGENGHLYLGYTNHSLWQLYSDSDSAPFRETNHQPELILSFTNDWEILGFRNVLNDLILNHQSNGQGGLLSRSWNRVMFTSVFERGNFAFALNPWYRLPESAQEYPGDPDGDDNPDITDYLGNFELNAAYQHHDDIYSLMLRDSLDGTSRGAIELGWSFPISSNLRGQFKYFNGYGHSLIDYNVDLEVFALGIVFTDLF
jgi:phospholipase A1